MLRNGFICRAIGGEAGAHRSDLNIPSKKAKMFRKLSCKNVQMGTNIFLNIFSIKLQTPKRLPGGTKCTYKVLASQMKNTK
jgi:hypothetical protein